MPEQFSNFDPQIYSPVKVQTQIDTQVSPVSAALAVPQTQVPSETPVLDSEIVRDGRQTLAANNMPESSMMEGVKATAQNFVGTKVWDYFNAPNFEATKGYNVQDSMDQLNLAVQPDEAEWLRSGANSPKKFNWMVDKLKVYREQSRIMAEHGGISTIGMILDPTFLPITVASGGLATVGRVAGFASKGAGRFISGTAGAAGMVAANVATEATRPVSLEEYVTGAVMVGAFTGAFYDPKTKAFKPLDEHFPTKEIRDITDTAVAHADEVSTVANILDESTQIPAKAVVVPDSAMPTSTPHNVYPTDHVTNVPSIGKSGVARPFLKARDVLGGLLQDTDPKVRAFANHLSEKMASMVDEIPIYIVPKSELNKGREYYVMDSHSIFTSKETGPYTKLHEITHALTSHKIDFGLANPTSAHGKLVAELDVLRVAASKLAKKEAKVDGADKVTNYFNKDLHEFTAGLFSGTEHFTTLLSKMAAPDGGNMLSKVVQVVRKLLGFKKTEVNAFLRAMDISSKLMDLPLHTTLENTKPGSMVDGIPTGTRTIRMAQPEGNPVQMATSIVAQEEKFAAKAGHALAWNAYKTLASFGETATRVARLIMDDPLNMMGDSVASQKRAIRADLDRLHVVYESLLLDEMATRGVGILKRNLKSREAAAVQDAVETEVALELSRRSRYTKDGVNIPSSPAPKAISDLADAHGAATKAALVEHQRAGVLGAEAVSSDPGYFTRKWNVTKVEGLEKLLVEQGYTAKAATSAVVDLLARGMIKVNGWDADLARDIAGAIVSRTKAKGYFEDNAFRAHAGNAAAKEVREILEASGISGDRLQRAMDVITGVVDEAGKIPSMKHRIDIDMAVTLPTKAGDVAIHTLIDTDLNRLLDSYIDKTSGQAALARKGLVSISDIDKLRTELTHSIPDISAREKAVKLFDDSMNHLLGNPTGETIPAAFRNMQALTQMVGLGMSGIWQVAETSLVMARYGMLKTLNYTIAELPGFRGLYDELRTNKAVASDLRNLLENNASQDVRFRPFIRKFEDNFEMPVSDNIQLALQQGKQLVPYINGMKWIHHKQAQIVGNLITDVFVRAAKGDADAISAMGKYGLESHVLDKIKSDIATHGTDTAKWTNGTWESVRGPLTKMMDEAVLKNRLGEVPAFAQFTALGKFIFTFRSFVLGAHNKVLAGTLHREGLSGYALLMLYQFPMNMMSVTAANTLRGKPPQDDKQLIHGTFSQMAAMGLLGEIYGIASGNKQQAGAPGLIFVDRLYKVGNAVASGNAGNTASAAINALPLLSIMPGMHAISETLKDKQHGTSKPDGSK